MMRTSVVRNIKVRTVVISSIFHVGDIKEISPVSTVLAIQRQISVFQGDEGNLEAFPIFSHPLSLPIITETAHMQVTHHSPYLYVDHIDILGLSTSSVLHIGSSECVRARNRTKHIRQLLRVTETPDQD